MGRFAVDRRTGSSIVEVALAAGFVAVVLATIVARQRPATGYELSIYESTPLLTWGLLLAALVIATWTIVRPTTARSTVVATILGGFATTTVASIPIIRGYHFVGSADSLTHLGWTMDIAADVVNPHGLFYPGFHSISLAVARFAGISLEQALLVGTVLLFVAFLAFVPITVWIFTDDVRSMGYAAIVSWFVLPINNVATHLMPHTNSLALFFVPLVLFVLVLYLRSSTRSTSLLPYVTPVGVALGLASLGMVVLHVQHAVNVLLLFLGICAIQFVARRRWPYHPIAGHRPLYAQTALLGGLVGLWFLTHETVARSVAITFQGLWAGDIGATAELAQRGGSLLEIGAGLGELFIKMFLVSAIVGLVALGYLVATGRGRLGLPSEHRSLVAYIALSFVPIGVLFVVYFFGTPTMSFRQLGFTFVLLTVVGALGLAHLAGWIGRALPLGRTVVSVVLVACLVLSLVTAFGSPYIYTPSPGVAEQELEGYETTMETRTDDVPLATLSSQPFRYGDAHYGTTESGERDYVGSGDGLVLPEAFNAGEPTEAYPDPRFHVAITEPDVRAELEVFDELNYRQEGLEALSSDPNVNRVVSNGEFDLYLVNGTES